MVTVAGRPQLTFIFPPLKTGRSFEVAGKPRTHCSTAACLGQQVCCGQELRLKQKSGVLPTAAEWYSLPRLLLEGAAPDCLTTEQTVLLKLCAGSCCLLQQTCNTQSDALSISLILCRPTTCEVDSLGNNSCKQVIR